MMATSWFFLLAPALAAQSGTAQSGQESEEWDFLLILMPVEVVHREEAEWGRRQHITAPNTCSRCNPCTKHCAVGER